MNQAAGQLSRNGERLVDQAREGRGIKGLEEQMRTNKRVE